MLSSLNKALQKTCLHHLHEHTKIKLKAAIILPYRDITVMSSLPILWISDTFIIMCTSSDNKKVVCINIDKNINNTRYNTYAAGGTPK